MLAAVWTGQFQLHVNQTADTLGLESPDSVRIRITAAGICGTDLHIWSGQLRFVDPPLVLGHEFAGIVEECGAAVRKVRPGDRVKCDSVVGCGQCERCVRGATQFCVAGSEFGITRNGGWTERLVVPERNLHRIPDAISDEVAAIMDVEVIGAVSKADVQPTDTVVIFGAGSAGLIALQCARLAGAARCIVCDAKPNRLALARKLGADVTIDIRSQDPVKAVRELTGGHGADLAIEAAGSCAALANAIEVLRPQGRTLLYGVVGSPVPSLHTDLIVLKDLTVLGALTNRTGWNDLIDLVATGKLNFASLITHRFPLADAPDALRFMQAAENGGIKAVLTVNPSQAGSGFAHPA